MNVVIKYKNQFITIFIVIIIIVSISTMIFIIRQLNKDEPEKYIIIRGGYGSSLLYDIIPGIVNRLDLVYRENTPFDEIWEYDFFTVKFILAMDDIGLDNHTVVFGSYNSEPVKCQLNLKMNCVVFSTEFNISNFTEVNHFNLSLYRNMELIHSSNTTIIFDLVDKAGDIAKNRE